MFSSEKCVELARKAHLDYTARLICTGQRRELIDVPSRDRNTVHTVCHMYENGALYCDCQAAQNGLNCCHVGAAIILIDQRAACYAAAASHAA